MGFLITQKAKFFIGLLMAILLLASCSTPSVTLQFQPGARLNPAPNQPALPVVVRVYQLQESTPFLQATFWQLWRHDQFILGQSLVSTREFILAPGISRSIKIKRSSQANYLGVMAIFRSPHSKKWRDLYSFSTINQWLPVSIKIKITGDSISIFKQGGME